MIEPAIINPAAITLTIAEIVSILGLATTVSGIFGTILWNLWRKVMENNSSVAQERQRRSDEVARVEKKASDELNEFKLFVAHNYVQSEKLADIEQRMIGSVDKLSNRIDQLIQSMGDRQ